MKKSLKESDLFAPVAEEEPTNPRVFRAKNTFFGQNEVKIVHRSENFTNWFRYKVEEHAPNEDLVPVVLKRSAKDKEIVAELGGEAKAEVTLAEIWRLMKRQPNGESGLLLVDGKANIFYVCDVEDTHRVVLVCWSVDGWDVGAGAVGGVGWCVGFRVFSRNS